MQQALAGAARAGDRCDPRVHRRHARQPGGGRGCSAGALGASSPPSLRACGRWRRSLPWSPRSRSASPIRVRRGLAQRLREPADGGVEQLQPERLRAAWRLRRLATHLETIDSRGRAREARAAAHRARARPRPRLPRPGRRAHLAQAGGECDAARARGAAGVSQRGAEDRQGHRQARRALPAGRARRGRRGEPRGAVLDHAALPRVRIAARRAGMLRPGHHRRGLAVRSLGAAGAAARAQDPHRRRRPPGLARGRGHGGGEGEVADAALPLRPGAAVPRADVAGAFHLRPRQGRVRAQRRDAQGALPLRGADHRVLQARVLSPRAQAAAAAAPLRAAGSAADRRLHRGRRAPGRRSTRPRSTTSCRRSRASRPIRAWRTAPSAWSRCSAKSRP